MWVRLLSGYETALVLFPNKEKEGWLGSFDFCLSRYKAVASSSPLARFSKCVFEFVHLNAKVPSRKELERTFGRQNTLANLYNMTSAGWKMSGDLEAPFSTPRSCQPVTTGTPQVYASKCVFTSVAEKLQFQISQVLFNLAAYCSNECNCDN